MTWQELSQKHPIFSYHSFHYELQQRSLVITFTFSLSPAIEFKPTVTIEHIDIDRFVALPKDTMHALVFHLGLIELFSYWKLAASPTIAIHCGVLANEQIDWWKDLLLNGMGEYLYRNEIPTELVKAIRITTAGEHYAPSAKDLGLKKRPLIPIGGGKDSAVAAHLLRMPETNALLLNPTPAAQAVAKLAGYATPINIKRTLDPKLLALNEAGYLNGHTPFSAYLAFLSVLCATLFDYRDIVLANENSANQPNVTYDGMAINHQYSKSFAFENAFHTYAKRYLVKDVNYFSFLRPVTELQIAKLFSHESSYFPIFRSCNVGQKENKWCARCAKCLFVYLILYPFLGKQEINTIFGQDLFANEKLLPLLQELLGVKESKPFECVGTYEEIRAALFLATEVNATGPLINYFKKEILPNYPNLKAQTERILASWNKENSAPEEYQEILRSALEPLFSDSIRGSIPA